MPMVPVLRITAFGEVDQNLLDQLRRDLDLTKRGRLSDDQDSEMGYRWDDTPVSRINVALDRDSPGTWTWCVAYLGEPPPSEMIDEYRTRILASIAKAGLVVNREWRR